MASVTQGNEELVNRSTIELELTAKDKEVSSNDIYNLGSGNSINSIPTRQFPIINPYVKF